MSKSSLPARPATAIAASVGLGLALACVTSLVVVGCVNPEDDFNAYVSRGADASAPPSAVVTGEAGPDVALYAPDASFDDTKLVMICVSELAQDVAKALLWEVHLTYKVNPNGVGGTLTYTSNGLAAGSTDVNAPLAGTTLGPFTATIAENGTGTVNIGSATLPAAQNGITGVAAPLVGAEILVHLESKTAICADLGGTVTEPQPVMLHPSLNPCIFLPTNASGAWPSVTTADVHCP